MRLARAGRLRRVLYGCLLAAALLGVCEGVLRVRYPVDALLFEWERPRGLVLVDMDGRLLTRAGSRTTQRDGPYTWRAHLDPMGFREDAPVPRARPAGVYRVLALGDSWVFGFSVDQGKTIPDHLERLLPGALGVPRVEVINAAVFGSSAFDTLANYRRLIEVYEVDAVLLGTPHNQGRFLQGASERAGWYRAARRGPVSTLRTYLLLRRWIAPLRGSRYAEPPVSRDGAAERADLRLLVHDARRRGLPVWFAEMPATLDGAMTGFSGVPEWRRSLQSLGALTGGHAMGERACWGFRDEGHPSEAGAAAIAARIAEVVRAGASIPVGDTPTCASLPEVGPTKAGWAW